MGCVPDFESGVLLFAAAKGHRYSCIQQCWVYEACEERWGIHLQDWWEEDRNRQCKRKLIFSEYILNHKSCDVILDFLWLVFCAMCLCVS